MVRNKTLQQNRPSLNTCY